MVMNIESQIARDSRIGSIDVISTRAALGAEVRGVDLKNLDEMQFTALKRAWHEYQVILVRDQTLSDQDLIAFSRRFGELDNHDSLPRDRHPDYPELLLVTNIPEKDGTQSASKYTGQLWHSDLSFTLEPSMGSLLRGITIPPELPWTTNSYWMYSILIGDDFGVSRDQVMVALKAAGGRPAAWLLAQVPLAGHVGVIARVAQHARDARHAAVEMSLIARLALLLRTEILRHVAEARHVVVGSAHEHRACR